MDSDTDAMMRAAKGDRGAFAGLFVRHHQSVARYVHRYVGSQARAEELTQEIFLKLYRSAGSYRPTASFKTFLFRVAANLCLNELRRGEYLWKRTEVDEDALKTAVAPEGEHPEAAALGRELERAVAAGLGEMKPRERAAFILCRFEGLSYREVAEALDTTEPAVKSLMHRAMLTMTRAVDSTGAAGTDQKQRRSQA